MRYERKTPDFTADSSELLCCFVPSCVVTLLLQVDFDAPLGYKEPERRPNHQDEPTVRSKHKWQLCIFCFDQRAKTSSLTGGRGRSQQLRWHGYRLQSEYKLMSADYYNKYLYNLTNWILNLCLIFRLSLVLAIVWMVKPKGLSQAPPLLPQVTSKGENMFTYRK